MNIDLDIKDVTGVGEAIEKASRGLERLFPGLPRRSEVKAEKAATKQALRSVSEVWRLAKEIGLSDEVTDYFCRDSVRRITRNENLDQIVSFAEPMVDKDAEVDDLIDSEWLNYFVDHAERVTDEEVQRVWASVLANEVNKRGSFSKNTMRILSVMDSESSRSFKRLCEFIADGAIGEVLVIEADHGGATYNMGAISYGELSNLSALGLVDASGVNNIELEESARILFAKSEGRSVSVERVEGGSEKIHFSPILTGAGRELSKLCVERDFHGIVAVLESKAQKKELRVLLANNDGCILDPKDAIGKGAS